MSTKKCSYCGLEKDLGEFYNAKRRRDGKQSRCKSCQNHTHGRAAAREQARPAPVLAVDQPRSGWDEIYGGQRCDRGHIYHGQSCWTCADVVMTGLARLQNISRSGWRGNL
jgi:hypothetical protein